jgi:trk system potassium uptake protein TrkA
MYIVIVGAGKVGYSLYNDLKKDGHEVLVIEKDTSKYESLEEEMGSALLQGSGCEVALLENAGLDRADIFVAVAGEDEDNLMACQLAKDKFAVLRVVARLNNPKNEHIFNELGIKCIVNVVDLILKNIKAQASICPLNSLISIGAEQELVLAKVSKWSKVVSKPIKALPLPATAVISLIIREGVASVPSDDIVMETGDELVCLVLREDIVALNTVFSG